MKENLNVEKLAESLDRLGIIPNECYPIGQPNLQESYRHFLSRSNGGYTSDRFFHFFGTVGAREHNVIDWNAADFWKKYFALDEDTFVFAEDILGTQFFFDVRANRRVVKMLVPDRGNVSLCSNTLEDFLEEEVFGDINSKPRQLVRAFFRGHQFEPFTHISCKDPLVFGGKAEELDNLELIESADNLIFLGQLVAQTKNLPTGTKIDRIRIIDPGD